MNSPYIDPNTGNYTLINGNILNTDATANRMISRLKVPKGGSMWSPKFGCELTSRIGSRFLVNKKTLEQWIRNALQDLVSDGTLVSLTVICTEYVLKSAQFRIDATDSAGKTIYLPWSLQL